MTRRYIAIVGLGIVALIVTVSWTFSNTVTIIGILYGLLLSPA